MINPEQTSDELRAAVDALKHGDLHRARQMVDHILMTSPHLADGWYLDSFVQTEHAERVASLGRALAANPLHEGANRRLAMLGQAQTAAAAGIAQKRDAEALKDLSLNDLLHFKGASGHTFVVEDAPAKTEQPKRGVDDQSPPKTKLPHNQPRWGAILALLAAGIVVGTPIAAVLAQPRPIPVLPLPTPLPIIITSTPFPLPPTPVSRFDGRYWDWSQPLLLRGEVNGLPAGTSVWLISMTFTGAGWNYEVRLDGGSGDVLYLPEEYLAFPYELEVLPAGTPMPAFPTRTDGFDLLLTADVGVLRAGTLVQVSRARYDGTQWMYWVVTEGERSADEVPESALTFAPRRR